MYYAHISEGDWRDYHVGDKIDHEWEDDRIPMIEYVQADGHELEAIHKMFQGTIPFPRCRVVRWYGDLARTIHSAMLTIDGFGVVR